MSVSLSGSAFLSTASLKKAPVSSRLAFVLAAFAAFVPPCLAQEAGRWEVGAFAGGHFGSRISLTPEADTRLGNGPAFSLRASFGLDRHFRLEGSLSRASVPVRWIDPVTGALLAPDAPAHVTTYEIGALYGFGGRRVRGFLGLGAGAMTLPSFGLGKASGVDTRFVAHLALGGELLLTDQLGVRVEGRYRLRVSDRRLGAVICESAGCLPFTTNLYSSAEITGGMAYRFGETSGERDLAPEPGAPRDFWTAAGEVVLLDALPWALNRYVSKADFAQVTPATIQANFISGYTYDRDSFSTNEFEHAIHGSLYFNAARANGYDFWESAAFALMGSYLWECCTEIEPPAINDLVNTALAGTTTGEISHRLSRMLLDNTATGFGRVWREMGAAFLNPIGAINRFARGDTLRNGPNSEDRFPSRFQLDFDLGYRHIEGPAVYPNQLILTLSAVYGDPFEGETKKPFDWFSLGVDWSWPSAKHLSRLEQRGILRGWDLTESSAGARHILGAFLGYEYLNNETQTFGTESFGAGLLSRYGLGTQLDAVSDVAAMVFPLAAIRTTDSINSLSGRNYDYGPGGGVRVAGALRKGGREIASLSYGVAWATTADGPSRSNTLQFFRASLRLPIRGRLGAGGGFSWYSRQTTYVSDRSEHRTQSNWRVFLSWRT